MEQRLIELFLDKTCDGNRISCYPSSIVREQPTVDAVPVVRCRDCRFHIKEDDFEYWCNGFCQPARLVNPDDYCSRGMLKECTIETCGYCENGLCYRAENAPKSRNCPFTKGEANEQ